MEKDRHLITAVRTIMKGGQRLKTHIANANIKPKETDCVLLDEADDVYFNHLKWFEKTFAVTPIVGFTASLPSQAERIEQLLIEKFF